MALITVCFGLRLYVCVASLLLFDVGFMYLDDAVLLGVGYLAYSWVIVFWGLCLTAVLFCFSY